MDRYEQAVSRGVEAERLVNSPMFDQAFTDTRAAILEAWASLEKSDSDHAKDLHRMVKCLDKVKRCLQEHIDTGKIAQKEIDGRSKRLFSLR